MRARKEGNAEEGRGDEIGSLNDQGTRRGAGVVVR